MALNYLAMNEAPRRYKYFDRFIDKAKYEEMRVKVINGGYKEERKLSQMKEIHSELLNVKKSRKALK